MAKFDALKTTLYKFYEKNKQKGRKYIRDKFLELGAPERSLDRWLTTLEENKSLERKVGSGRRPKFATKANIANLKNYFNHRSGRSQRKYARKLNCHQTTVGRILKKSTNIVCRKRQKKPKMSEQQKKKARPKCRKLITMFAKTDFVIDDESYFTLGNTTLAGNDRFYSDNLEKTPDDVKYKYQEKFEKKILVWIAISPAGVSTPIFFESKMAINQDVYLDKCIKARLIPFIRRNYPNGGYVFWPDLASSHYAKKVQDYLQAEKIQVVPKEVNPANLPKARPIEDFWGILKQKVYENGWCAKTIDELESRIKYCLRKMDKKLVQDLALATHKRLDTFRRYGV